jgi:predicted transcriptional regulator
MSDPKVPDNQVRHWIIMTVGDNGASWEKLDRILRFNGPMGQLKRVLESLEKSGHVNLEGKRYQLTKKGREIYKILNENINNKVEYK